MRRLGGLLTWSLALALLHVAAIAPLPFARGQPLATSWRMSPDLVVAVAIAVLGATIGRARLLAHLAAVPLLAAIVYRCAAFYVQLMLERQLDLRLDVFELKAVLHLLTHDSSVPPWLVVVAAVLLLLSAELLLAWALARVARPARGTRGAVVLIALLQALVLVDVVRSSCDPQVVPSWHRSALVELGGELRQAIVYWWDPEAFDGPIRARLAEAAAVMAATPTDLGALDRADVHLVIVESYGRYAHGEPQVAARLRSLWQQTAPELQAAGVQVCTGVCQPSITGGESWLAHAQLLSSARIGHRRQWQLLLESAVQSLPKRFQLAGYHTVEVMPAMDRHWPEGQRFFGFDEAITQLELGYRGIAYHWGRMPDQYALHHLLERVVAPARQPLFSVYISVTSHVPFRLVPPYVADWRIDADTFAGPPRVRHDVSWLDVPYGPKLVTAYADTLEYSLRSVIGFVARLPRPSLVIVLGDHQPPLAGVAGEPARRFDVPMHVFANRPQLLAPLRVIGFGDGFEIPANFDSFSTTEFAPTLLRVYSR